MLWKKSKSDKVSCPVCNQKHWWNRRQMIAYDSGKSVQVYCLKCGQKYWVWKCGNRAIISKERENECV